MVVCPVTFSLFPFFRFPMVVSNLFLWYDEGQDLFFGKKKICSFCFKMFRKKKKKQKQKWRKKHEKYKGLC